MNSQETYTIRDIREANYLTLGEFAEKIGVSILAVHKWEAGKSRPHVKNLRKVAEKFDVDISKIVTGIDTRRSRRT